MSVIIAHLQQREDSKTEGRCRLFLDLEVLILRVIIFNYSCAGFYKIKYKPRKCYHQRPNEKQKMGLNLTLMENELTMQNSIRKHFMLVNTHFCTDLTELTQTPTQLK